MAGARAGDLPANLFRTGVLRTLAHGGITRPAPALFAMLGLEARAFWDDARDLFPWVVQLERETERIHEEYAAARDVTMSDYDVRGGDEHTLHDGEWEWRSYILKGERQESFAKTFPATRDALETVPGLQSGIPFAYSFFSTLKPGSRINTHTAPCNLRLRGHLPLQVPEGDCGIEVGGQRRKWEVGKLLLFDDSFPHRTWHAGENSDRVILLFDIWHPQITPEEQDSITEMFAYAQKTGQSTSPPDRG